MIKKSVNFYEDDEKELKKIMKDNGLTFGYGVRRAVAFYVSYLKSQDGNRVFPSGFGIHD